MDHLTGDGREEDDEETLREWDMEDRDDGAGQQRHEEEEEEEEVDDQTSVNLMNIMSEKLVKEPVKVRVHDIEIRGNVKTKDSVIEAQLKELREVDTMQELLQECVRANSRLRALGIFDKCVITLDAGPQELPGTANVILEVEEVKRLFSGDLGMFSKPEVSNRCCCSSRKCCF